MPFKRPEECDPNHIGLNFNKIHTMNDDVKYRYFKNVWRPPAGYVFPQHVELKRNWRPDKEYIDPSSIEYFPWLCYSAYYDGVFYLPCVACASSSGKSAGLKYFSPNSSPVGMVHNLVGLSHLYRDTASTMHTFIAEMKNKEKRITENARLQRANELLQIVRK